jgi:tRNA threonylcarbamoyladenosine biosynthesis protein TsaE
VEAGNKSIIELGILSEIELVKNAEVLAKCLRESDILILSGEIGTGKTTFVRGIVQGLGCNPMIVTSPTFTLMNVYTCEKTIYHLDAYRLKSVEDIFYILEGELEENEAIFIIEWGELVERFFNKGTINIRFEHVNEIHRKVTILASEDVIHRLRRCF